MYNLTSLEGHIQGQGRNNTQYASRPCATVWWPYLCW